MIRILKYGEVSTDEIFARSVPEVDVAGIVSGILSDVRARGDEALFDYCERFDKVRLERLEVSDAEFDEEDHTFHHVFSRADHEMYLRKRQLKRDAEKRAEQQEKTV